MSDLHARAMRIRLAVFDCDGVFTDGRLWLGDDGHEYKSFHVHDGVGIKRLLAAGIEVAVISGRRSSAVQRRMKELGISHLLEGVDDKLGALRKLQAQLEIDDAQTMCVGDDLPDLPPLKVAGLAIAVGNAVADLDTVVHHRTTAVGGHGAVREICDWLLNLRSA